MDWFVNDTHKNLTKKIEDILIKCLIGRFEFVCSVKSLWDLEFDDVIDKEEFNEYIIENSIEDLFNGEQLNDTTIFECYEIGYEMDYDTFIHMCKYVKEEYDMFDSEMFSQLFDMDTDTEQRIINAYAYFYIRNKIRDEPVLDSPIIHIHRNIAKYNFNNRKHSGLIRLYNKLDKLNKKKIVISKILNDKFDTDILQTILQSC
jgi:hypothetical protein